jgi:cytochrome c biogenesis protein CcdA
MAYQPYPTTGKQPLPQGQEAPGSVQNAVKLMYAGAVISFIGAIIVLAIHSRIESAIGKAAKNAKKVKPLTPHQLHTAEVTFVVALVVVLLIAVALWLWMARMNGSGRRWARIVASVLFGFNTLWLFYVFRAPATAIFVGLGWLVGLGALFLLWRPESTQYYNSQSGQLR